MSHVTMPLSSTTMPSSKRQSQHATHALNTLQQALESLSGVGK
jgi:hypothetical protein